MKLKDIQLNFKNHKSSITYQNKMISPGNFYINNGELNRNYKNPFGIFHDATSHYMFMKQRRDKFLLWGEENNKCLSLKKEQIERLEQLKIV